MSKDVFRQVSWDDLGAWAGSTTLSRGRSYIKNVSQLCLTPPFLNVLLDIALAEKKPDEVLHWYDVAKKSRTNYGWNRYSDQGDDRIAEAVKKSYPECAVQIWQDIAENLIAQTSVTNYQIAAQYLRKLKPLMGEAWRGYITKLREENKRKPSCVEILDGLAGRSILRE